MRTFSMIVALDQNNGIGKDGELPWHIPADLKHFKKITTQVKDPNKQNLVIMGRKTWESIPEKYRPLAGRINCVLSRNKSFSISADVTIINDLNSFLDEANFSEFEERIENIFVIGGAEIFNSTIDHPACEKLILTHIEEVFECDTFFPDYQKSFQKVSDSEIFQENAHSFYFAEYQRFTSQE